MRINHNIAALNTYRQLAGNNALSSKSLEKLSSGYRINRAGDDAAGLAISEKMRSQIRGLDQASRNSQDAISLIQTAEGALNETHSILQRMRELAVQAASATNTDADRAEVQKEINQLTSEINRIGNTTEFNTMKLLDGQRANTSATFLGGYMSASGATTTVVASLGTLTAASGLASGAHSLVVSKTSENLADQTVTNSEFKTSGGATSADYTFLNNQIKISGVGVTMSSGTGLNIAFGSGASGEYITLTGSGSTGALNDTVMLSASGSVQYDNFDITFTFTNVSMAAGEDIYTTATILSGNGTFGTSLQAYSSANTGGNDWLISGGGTAGQIGVGSANSGVVSGSNYLPDTVMTWNITLSGASGGSGFIVSGSGADGTVITDYVQVNLSAGSASYSGYGLNFTVSGGTADSADKITFTTTPKYSWTSVLDGTSSGSLGSGQTGIPTVAAGTSVGTGLTLSGAAALAVGTYAFTSYGTAASGSDLSLTFQIGANQNQSMSLDVNDMRSAQLGVSKTTSGQTGFRNTSEVTSGTTSTVSEYALNVSTVSGAANAITVIATAISTVSSERAKLGAYQNRLEHTINNLGTSSENLTAAESRIRDVDMAKEMMEFTKNNILQQAAQAMLAQANQQPQGVLQLLR